MKQTYELYRILKEDSRDDLERKLDGMLAQGWQPMGGVCVLSTGREQGLTFYQAVAKPAAAE